jgi:drug/metabolite transporter (DMT)-like permease
MPDPEPLTPAGEDAAEAVAAGSGPGLAPNVVGALWMLGSAMAFTAMTTLIKYLGDGYPAMLQTFYRMAAGLVVILPWIIRDPRGTFRTTRPGILLFRSGVGTVAMILAFYAYQEMPLADANALSFTRTLWLVPLAALVLKESLGPWRLGAALVGFLGVVLMLRPGAEGAFSLPALAALGSAFLFALTITGMKVMTRDHSAFTLLAYAALLGVIFSLPPALFVWRWPTWPDLGLLALMGVIGTGTQLMYIRGMQVGDAAAMAPIDYTRLVFSGAAGFLLFSEVPDAMTIAGAVVVVASTLAITWREQRVARKARAPG